MDSYHIDRETLKSYFKKGRIPTEEQFAALIDSLHNIREDGLLKVTATDGLVLSPSGGGKVVATVYAETPASPAAAPLWRVAVGDDGVLEIRNSRGMVILMLGQDGSATVPGSLKAGRCLSGGDGGTSPEDNGMFHVDADGHWHDLPVEYADNHRSSDGCRVYRVCACWHHSRSGKISVCEAVASHSDGSHSRIRSARKHWWGWSGKIKLRWQMHDGHLYLQMRSRWTRHGAEPIACRIETVWDM